MKTNLIILVLALLGFSHAGYAQAPKEVIVLDGQIAINNGPINPASVMVENGVLNPVPVLDVTPRVGEPILLTGLGTYCPPCGGHTFEYSAPQGKQFKLQGVSVGTNAIEPTSPLFGFAFFVVQHDADPIAAGGQILGVQYLDQNTTQRSASMEFDYLTPVPFISVHCEGVSSGDGCRFTVWGQLVNAP